MSECVAEQEVEVGRLSMVVVVVVILVALLSCVADRSVTDG